MASLTNGLSIITTCRDLATRKGASVFAVKYGTQCLFSTSTTNYKKNGVANECNYKCGTDSTTPFCGGNYMMDVYSITHVVAKKRSETICRNVTGAKHLGCFKDTKVHALPALVKLSGVANGMDVITTCRDIAKSLGKRFFGLQNSDECYIGNGKYDIYGSATQCDNECGTNSMVPFCGSSYKSDVYCVDAQ